MPTLDKIYQDLNAQLTQWEGFLDKYTLAELQQIPSDSNWSLGQVYLHLIIGTEKFHLANVWKTIHEPQSAGEKSDFGKNLFKHNGFPPVDIKGPNGKPQPAPPQATSKEGLKSLIHKVQEEVDKAYEALQQGETGKLEHPAFGALTGAEWFQMIEMHWRHHLRQKAKIDEFLGKA